MEFLLLFLIVFGINLNTHYPPILKYLSTFHMQYEALAWLCGGLSIYGLVGLLAVWNDKPSKMPYVYILFYDHVFIINIQGKHINSVVLV